jgi:hypothetical protein
VLTGRPRLRLNRLEDRSVPAALVVNSLTDTGTGVGTAGDLRYCIGIANANGEDDTITFDPALFATPQTIVLGGTELALADDVGKSLAITTAGAAGVTINANGLSRVFNMTAVAGGVTLTGLTLTKGTAADGGAILATDTPLTLNACTVTGNTATATGGGLSIYNGSVALSGCTVSNNTVDNPTANAFGAGLAVGGTANVTLATTLITGNTAKAGAGYFGYGGGFNSASTGTIAMSDSTISANTSVGASGGALRNTASKLTITNSLITGNAATAGGNYPFLHSSPLDLTISGTTVSNNTANLGGGVRFVSAGGVLTVSGSTFSKNISTGGAGGGLMIGTATTSDACTISNCVFDENTTTASGAGLRVFAKINLLVTDCTFFKNSSTSAGGAVFLSDFGGKTITFERCTFEANTTNNSGGAISTSAASTGGVLVLRNSTFVGNTAPAGNGGMFRSFTSFAGTVNVENCTIVGNSASGSGGGISFGGSTTLVQTLNIVSSIVAKNLAGGNPSSTVADLHRSNAAAIGVIAVDFSLIGVVPTTPPFTEPNPGSNLKGSTAAPLDPLLLPIGNFGGPTRTAIPTASSPVIDVGSNPAGLSDDQRGAGFPRAFNGKVDMGATEAFNPLPVVSKVTAPAVVTAGGLSYEFDVTFTDNTAINVATLGTPGAVTVSGPGFGTPAAATFVKVDVNSNGTPRTATYQITPPGGSWDLPDNGLYTVNIVGGKIFDTDAPTPLSVPAGPAGSFLVGIPQTFVVNATNDEAVDTDGKTSLREAVLKANASAGADAIVFDPVVFATPQTITYALGQINVTDSVTITGPAAQVTLDALSVSNHLNVSGFGTLNVAVSRMRFISGQRNTNALGQNGGSIFGSDENLTVTDCVFEFNKSALAGSAIGLTGGNLTISKSTFNQNIVEFGFNFAGAVHYDGPGVVTITDSTFTSNTGEGSGGALRVANAAKLNVANCTFSVNSSTAANFIGGAMLINNVAQASVSGSTFSGNEQTNGGAGGALAVLGGGTVVVDGSSFTNNKAVGGAGGAIWTRSDTTASVAISRSTIRQNDASGTDGGGIRVGGNHPLIVTGTAIAENTAAGRGGGIHFDKGGTLTMTNSTVSGNVAGNSGGGVYFFEMQTASVIQNSTVTANTASGITGGGISLAAALPGGTLTLSSTIVAGNTNPAAPDVSADGPTNVFGTFNLIGVADAGNITFTGANNQTGTLATPLDAKLDVLANNGGPTPTHALLALSPALNSGNNLAGLAGDQRGFQRVVGGQADVGAFESGGVVLPPPTVTQVQVNTGGAQRSLVTQLQVTFSETVSFPFGTASAFQLSRVGPGGPTGLVNLVATPAANVVTLTFTGGGAVPIDKGGSLIDGVYQLVVVASAVQGASGNLDGDGNGTPGDNFVTPTAPGSPGRLHRLFGDNDGDADVDAQDFGAFRSAFGGTSNLNFDFDGDGDVDAADFGQFRARFGSSV